MTIEIQRFVGGMKRDWSARPRSTTSYLKKFRKQINKLWDDAIGAFVIGMVNNMSVDTGMSVATLSPLARKMNVQKFISMKLAMSKGAKKGHRKLYGKWADNNASYKSVGLGERLGEYAYTVTYGDANHIVLGFEFDIKSFQHFMRESDLSGFASTAPWNSIEAGMEAMKEYIQNHIQDYIPSVARWLFEGEAL